ncbi:MAG TPA: PhzF family phenazine biosynthesis protein [Gammaproteobacteria bacterium]|nr:PhzF family phenazine biosynthesis protein [Gammaproteobacteria bacterium]
MKHGFQLVDVFGESPDFGNALAVISDGEDLTTEAMLKITRWLNLSETVFLLPPGVPGADYRARIFTLEREMPFAGHPTLGACHAWLSAGNRPRNPAEIVQECGIGLVRIRNTGTTLEFAAPPLIDSGDVEESRLTEISKFLGIPRSRIVDARWADNGPGWFMVLLGSAAEVLELKPARSYEGRLDLGVVGPYPASSPAAFELRAFFTDHLGSVREDPVTGSLNACVAEWLVATSRASLPYIASQGSRVGRSGRVYVTAGERGEIWIGGRTTTLFAGTRGSWE